MGVVPFDSHHPGQRRAEPAEHSFERQRRAGQRRQRREHPVDAMHQRDESDQHGRDVQDEFQAFRRASTGCVQQVGVGPRNIDLDDSLGGRVFEFGHHDLGNDQRSGGRHQRGDHQVTRIGPIRNVGGHGAAGHRSHAAGHQGHQLGSGHGFQVGPNGQRRRGHAHEYVRRRTERLGARDVHHADHHPGHEFHPPLQHAEVEQHGGQRRKEDHGRHDGEGEIVIAEAVTEDELGALVGAGNQPGHESVGPGEDRLAQGGSQEQQPEGQLQAHAA